MTSRIEQADAAIEDVFPGWKPPHYDDDPHTSPNGLLDASLYTFTDLSTGEEQWCAVVSFEDRRVGSSNAPIESDPRDALRLAIVDARKSLETAISTLPEVTP
jgi:hypothetical protein